jgi:PleD family two-component response regulator
MEAVMIVDEIASDREELARALQAEGFRVVQSDSASTAVREIWEGSFLLVFIAAVLTDTDPNSLANELRELAPEVETIIHAKQDDRAKLVRKATDIRDGMVAVAG